MTEYTITVNGYESGLTGSTVEQVFEDMLGRHAGEVTITVEEASDDE
jgi:hypothetical protein